MNFVKPTGQPAATLVHISDFHLCRPRSAPWSAFVNKRALSLLSWKARRGREHGSNVFDALVEAARRIPSDQVAVTGDLTQLGLSAEFEQARAWLRRLGPPEKVFVVPGNHDALVAPPAGHPFPFAAVADYMASDPAAALAQPEYPTLRLRGCLALIGVSSAHPTPPFSAAGSIGRAQFGRLAALLADCGRRALYRTVLIHHPPSAEGISPRKRLQDAPDLRALIERHGAELILHGHIHRRFDSRIPGPAGPVPVCGTSSATALAADRRHRALLRVFRIHPAGPGWRTTLQDFAYHPDAGRFLPESEKSLH